MEKNEFFPVTLFTAWDLNGDIRNSQESKKSLWDNHPEIITELKRLVSSEKMVLMGRKTYELLQHETTEHFFLNNAIVMFVLTKSTQRVIHEKHNLRVFQINSKDVIPVSWWLCEEKIKERRALAIAACRKAQEDCKKKSTQDIIPEDQALAEKLEQEIENIRQKPIPSTPEIIVIGGVSLYAEMVDYAKTIHAILMHSEFSGNESFPLFFNEKEWRVSSRVDSAEKKADGQCVYTFVTYRRNEEPPKYLSVFRPNLPPLPPDQIK